MAYEKITVSGEKLINTIREVADEHPEYLYEAPADMLEEVRYDAACFYVHTSPAGPVCGCIVGHALHRLGVPLDELALHEGSGAGRAIPEMLELTGLQAGVSLTMATATQDAQDGAGIDGKRHTWSNAVAIGSSRAGLSF